MAKYDKDNALEFLEVTFDSIDQGITIWDKDLRLVAWNPRFNEIGLFQGYNLEYGTYLLDVYEELGRRGTFGPGDPKVLAELHVKALRDGPLIESELLTPPSGRAIQIKRFRLPGGGICATFQDVTDEIRTEERLRQSIKMEAIGKLTGGIAHDFNNVLAVVLASTELAMHSISDDKTRAELERVIKACDRGSELTHRLLAFARKQPLAPEVLELSTLLRPLLEMLPKLLGEDVAVELSCDRGLWSCQADRHQLENVIINLAVNARDAMPDGGRLTITVHNVRVDRDYAETEDLEAGEFVCLAVTDTGTGMDRAVRERAFDPFFTTKEVGKGTGLGLSMAHGFVKQSGGHIIIDSEPGRGTTIKIYLPRIREAVDPASDPRAAATDCPGQGELILVVEDDPDLRETMVGQVQSLNYETLEAETAAEALSVVERHPELDLMLTDIVLPGGENGRQLAEKVGAMRPGLCIVFMSGYAEGSASDGGPPDIVLLQKPFRRQELSATLREALEGRDSGH